MPNQPMPPLIPGEPDPIRRRIVKTVAVETDAFHVFIDNDNEIYYYVSQPDYPYPEDFNNIHSVIRRLEVTVLANLGPKEQAYFNYLLANNLGEVLEEKAITGAMGNLKEIEKDIETVINSNQKKYFTYGTNTSLLMVLAGILLLYLYKAELGAYFSEDAFTVMHCCLFGGIGSLLFNYGKTKKYVSNRIIGKFNHFLDGSLRIMYGVLYALIAILGIKAGVILGMMNESPYLLAFVATVVGASDTLITSMLKSFWEKTQEKDTAPAPVQGSGAPANTTTTTTTTATDNNNSAHAAQARQKDNTPP